MKAKYFYNSESGKITADSRRNHAVLEPQYFSAKKIAGFGVFDLIRIGGEVAQIISLISEDYAAAWVVPHDMTFQRLVFFVSATDLAEHAELILEARTIKSQIHKIDTAQR